EAGELMDAFVKKHPQAPMVPVALYYSALSDLGLESYARARAKAVQLQTKHPDSDIIPASYNLRGDAILALGTDPEMAMVSYKRALHLVKEERLGEANVGGYACKQIIKLANELEDWETSANTFTVFQDNFASTAWRTEVYKEAVTSLAKTDRKDEGKILLEELVADESSDAQSAAFDDAFTGYVSYLNAHYTEDEARDTLQAFANQSGSSPGTRAFILTAAKNFGEVDALYRDNPEALSTSVLVKLANWKSAEKEDREGARKIYSYLLRERNNGADIGVALIEMAKLEADILPDESMNLFQRALNETSDPAIHEQAVLGAARLKMERKEYREALKWWDQYRSNPNWRSAIAEAGYQTGHCMHEMNRASEAAATFVSVYSNFPDQVDWSTKAYLDTAKIVKAKGQDVDALKILRDMIQRVGPNAAEHPNIIEGKKLFFAWRDEYAAKLQK
ncbi:MAG: hypothetical protein AAF226_17000, partial [Verrucomicrobiota bacterium]